MAKGGGKVRRILGIGQRICAASASRHLSEYSGFLRPRCQVARQVGQPKCQLVAGPLRIIGIAFVEAARKEAMRSDQESLENVGKVTCCSYDLHAFGEPLPPPWLGEGGGHGGQHDQPRLNGAERRPHAKPLSSGLPQVLQRRRKLLGTQMTPSYRRGALKSKDPVLRTRTQEDLEYSCPYASVHTGDRDAAVAAFIPRTLGKISFSPVFPRVKSFSSVPRRAKDP
jgi:hypothetical protein